MTNRRFINYSILTYNMNEKIDFDIKKLKPEDRRLLMSRSLSVASTNATNRLTNTSLIISYISMLIALFSLVFSIQNGFTEIVIIVLIIEVIFLALLLWWYFSAQKKVTNQTKAAEDGHNLMFKKHFEYAKKK